MENHNVEKPQHYKNMVLVILESMENSMGDESVFNPSLIPRLQKIQNNALSFKQHLPGVGAGWTIAATTSYLMGVPLKLPINGNKYDGKYAGFLPGAKSILSVLEEDEYKINLVMGSNSKFSGLDSLFLTHAVTASIYDSSYFKSRIGGDKTALKGWGCRDKEVYALARELIGCASKERQPFFTVLMTIDTHVPAKAFGDYPQPYGDARDSFVAADHMASEFLSWLMDQPFYKDTVVVFVGDHPYMGKELGAVEFPPSYKRTVYNAILNSGQKARLGERRTFYSFDFAPTLLEALGYKLPGGRFGLGTSLLGKEATLLERYGAQVVNEGLSQRSRLYDSFFEAPQNAVREQASLEPVAP